MTAITATIPEHAPSPRVERSKQRLLKTRVGSVNLTPMVDVIFNLLVYFLCVGLINLPEGALPAQLPSTHGQVAPTLPVSPIEIDLLAGATADEVTIELRPLNRRLPGGMPQLYEQMRALAVSRDFGIDAPVILQPESKVPAAVVVDAYNAAYTAGFKQIAFGESRQ